MISQSERDRTRYEIELKNRRDLINRDQLIFGQGRDEGREEGREEGLEQGLEQGQLIARIQLLARLLGEPVEELRQLSLESLSKQADELVNRARDRGMPAPQFLPQDRDLCSLVHDRSRPVAGRDARGVQRISG